MPEIAASVEAFEAVKDESEFGRNWETVALRYAYRIWKAVKDRPEVLDSVGDWPSVPGVPYGDLGMSLAQAQGALSMVRRMLHRPSPSRE